MKALRRILICLSVASGSVFGQAPDLLKPPSEGPLSSAPPPAFPLQDTAIKGVPLSGVKAPGFLLSAEPKEAIPDAEATLVVFNSNDSDSADLARFYAEKRGIPKSQVLGVACTQSEEVGRAEYDLFIARPIKKAFDENHWWEVRGPNDKNPGMITANRIRYVVLMRGMPLKILPTTNYEGDRPSGPPAVASHNEASVDSELAVLAIKDHPISGILMNPYFRSYTRFAESKQLGMMLVCRLDAPTPAIVRRMILDSLAAEKNGLRGMAYVDARGITDPGYVEGDRWLFGIANDGRRRGIPVVLDQGPGLFPDAYPMRQAAFYFGWYAENVTGPFLQPDFHFEPGAVAVHIHSFSAASLRDPHKNWCAPLLAAGAAATLGNVFEPFLDFTPHVDIFFDRLTSGFTFAESAYMSERVLSWMTVCIGDPLYRPFPALTAARKGPPDEWSAYREGAVEWFKDRAAGEAALRKSGNALHSGVIFEGLGLLELTANGRTEALEAFGEARKNYKNPDDIVRVAIHEIGVLQALNRPADALALARKEISAYPKLRADDVLRMLEPEAGGR